jgi:tetratricopeptide (TPR) repeat protein
LQHPLDRQRLLIANNLRFRTWALCELLLDSAREEGFHDPAKALELARLGALTAEHLDASLHGDGRARDLAARAWATLGNAERIRSDFHAAEKCFQRAERLLKQGTGDPLEKAGVLLLKASLLGNQQRFFEAFRVLDRVVSIGRKYGDLHLCGKAMITRGFLCAVAAHDAPETDAHRWLSEGLELVDPAAEPRLVVAARHNLILHLAECGRNAEALQLLEQTRPLYAFLGDQMNLLRLRWVEGRIAVAQGRFARAEPMLQEVRKEFVEREIGYDAALVSLDLARIYARQGRSTEMRRLAEEMLPIFNSRQIQREALTALVIFQKAAEMESVTLGLVQELSEYLDRTRKNPGSRFRESV